MSFGRIPHPVSVTSIRTTIHSRGGAGFACSTLCCVRCVRESRWWKSAPALPFECAASSDGRRSPLSARSTPSSSPSPSTSTIPSSSSSSSRGCRSGIMSFVVIVSFPPAWVNLHALLQSQTSALAAIRDDSYRRDAPGQIRDDLPQPRLVPDDDPVFVRVVFESALDRVFGLAHRFVQCTSRDLTSQAPLSERPDSTGACR